jgi:hypothetical protein
MRPPGQFSRLLAVCSLLRSEIADAASAADYAASPLCVHSVRSGRTSLSSEDWSRDGCERKWICLQSRALTGTEGVANVVPERQILNAVNLPLPGSDGTCRARPRQLRSRSAADHQERLRSREALAIFAPSNKLVGSHSEIFSCLTLSRAAVRTAWRRSFSIRKCGLSVPLDGR